MTMQQQQRYFSRFLRPFVVASFNRDIYHVRRGRTSVHHRSTCLLQLAYQPEASTNDGPVIPPSHSFVLRTFFPPRFTSGLWTLVRPEPSAFVTIRSSNSSQTDREADVLTLSLFGEKWSCPENLLTFGPRDLIGRRPWNLVQSEKGVIMLS